MPKKRDKSPGSLIPSILKLEGDLHELVLEEEARSEKILRDAETEKARLISELRKDIEHIRHEERETILRSVEHEIADIETAENEIIAALKKAVEKNRANAIDYILSEIVPRKK